MTYNACSGGGVVNGACGSAHEGEVGGEPHGTAACAQGTRSAVSESWGMYMWSCQGSNGGTDSGTCYATQSVDPTWNNICHDRGIADYNSTYDYYTVAWVPSVRYTYANWSQNWSGTRNTSNNTTECAWMSTSGDLVSCTFIINSSDVIMNRYCTSPFYSGGP